MYPWLKVVRQDQEIVREGAEEIASELAGQREGGATRPPHFGPARVGWMPFGCVIRSYDKNAHERQVIVFHDPYSLT